MTRKFDPKDLAAGALLVAIGLLFLWLGRDLDPGTARRMGPGYLPFLLAGIVTAFGVAVAVAGLWGERRPFGPVPWRGLVLVVGGTVLFGVALRGLGLVPSIVLTVLAASFASRGTRPVTAVILAAALTLASWLIFVEGLGLPFRVIGPWVEFGGAPPAPAAPP